METKNIRRFNRYYTRILGVFDKQVFDLNYSMLEMRLLGEIFRQKGVTAQQLANFLNVDKSYLSRTLHKLITADLIAREKDTTDQRVWHLFLTEAGVALQQQVERLSDQEVENIFSSLSPMEIKKIETAMATIEEIMTQVVPLEMEE